MVLGNTLANLSMDLDSYTGAFGTFGIFIELFYSILLHNILYSTLHKHLGK